MDILARVKLRHPELISDFPGVHPDILLAHQQLKDRERTAKTKTIQIL